MRGSARRSLLVAAAAAALAACESIFSLNGYDTPAGSGGATPDGGTGGGYADGSDGALGDAGAADAPPDGPPPNPCAGKADGTQWDTSDYFARCCGGQPVHADKDLDNCGVCGLKCINGQTCEAENAAQFPKAVYCTGCAGNACSGPLCCVKTVTTQGVCVPDNCTGTCVDSQCSSGKCQTEGMTVNDYCYY
jgi:hypothetical protein